MNNRSKPPGTFIPVLPYADMAPAVKWLCEAFGFKERLRIEDHRTQLAFNGGGLVVVPGTPVAWSGQFVLVSVENADAHFERAKQHGAKVIRPPENFPYGERQFMVEDFAGYRWTFSQSIADVDPQDWGGVMMEQ